MSLLTFLWLLSLALSGIALVGMVILVLRRLILQKLQDRRGRTRKRLLQDVLSYLEGDLAAEELGRRAASADSVLSELLSELAQLVRGSELTKLMALFEELGLMERLLHDLKHGDRHKRLLSARNLSYASTEKCIKALQAALDDRDPDVRLAAASSLTELQAAPHLDVLIDKLQLGSGERSRALLQVFRSLTETRSEELLACLDQEQTTDFIRILILDALGKSGQYQSVPHIIQATSDSSIEVRAAALRALAELQHPAASRSILQALSDTAWEVRTQAATCAGRLGLKEAIDPLAHLLDDRNWWTRYRAAEALHVMGENGQLKLNEIATSGQESARRIASMVLAERTSA